MAVTAEPIPGRPSAPALNAAKTLEGLFASFLLFIATGAVFPLLRHSHGEGTVTITSGGPESVIYSLSFVLTALLAYRERRQLIAIVRAEPVLWLLPVLAVLSLGWSTDRHESFKTCVALSGAMLFGAYVAVRFDAGAQLRILALTFFVIVVLSIAFVIAEPTLGLDVTIHTGAWRGIFSHKNNFGRIMSLGFAIFAVTALTRPKARVYAVPLGVACAVLTFLSESRTSMIAALGVIGLLAAYPLLRRVRVRSWMVGLALVGVLAAIGALAWSQRGSVVHPDPDAETLTGRTVLWAVVLLKIMQHPLLGYGYESFWTGKAGDYVDVWRIVGWPAAHSHDAFLDVALDFGAIGLALFVAVCVRNATRALSLQRLSGDLADRLLPSSLIAFTILAHFTEGQLFRNNVYWMLFTVASVSTTRQLLRARADATGASGAKVNPTRG